MPSPFTTPVALSTPFEPGRNPDYTGQIGQLTAQNVQDAIEEAYWNAPGKIARFTIQLLNNGTMTNGQRFTKSELLPNTPIIVPYTCNLKALAFTCNTANADWSFQVSKWVGAVQTVLFTWTGTNAPTAYRNDRDDSFAAGDEIRIIFTDTGDNPADASMDMYFQIV